MKKTSKILLGIIGGSWLLFICALFIPQCFEIEVERIDSDTTESSPQAKTYTKGINSPFKHIVINSSSNYDIKIHCNTHNGRRKSGFKKLNCIRGGNYSLTAFGKQNF